MPHATPTPITAPATVVVTGANGFIASHAIHQLLTAGFHVVGTVRSPAKAELVHATHATLTPEASSRLTTHVIPDMTQPDAYTSLFATTTPAAVLHLASPFAYDVTDFERDLMAPAVRGTEAVLLAALATPSIRRIVHTNSFACIYDAALGPRKDHTYTHRDWSPLRYEDGARAPNAPVAYRASKAVAEQTAWRFLAAHPSAAFDLVSLCPAMVFGPFLDTRASMPASIAALNTSNKLVWDVVSAGEAGTIPPTKGPVWIDVRDVAGAHVTALTDPNLGGRRMLLAKGVYCSQEIADVGREVAVKKARSRIPVGTPGAREAATHFAVDAREEERELGLGGKWRGLAETLADLLPQLYRIEAQEGGAGGVGNGSA